MGESLLPKEHLSEWVAEAAPAVSISIHLDSTSEPLHQPFHPEFTHQHFGEKETIFGYREPKLSIGCSAGGLALWASLSHKGTIDEEKKELRPDDVLKKLAQMTETPLLHSEEEFRSALEAEAEFRPPGELIHAYSIHSPKERDFELYAVEPSAVETRNIQALALFFIDALSYTDKEDERWTFFLLYEKVKTGEGKRRYCIAGYAALYDYYAFPEHRRPRIGQMLLLPPYRQAGHGPRLLQALYRRLVPQSNVRDITVEDPSEHFTAMRDLVDVANARGLDSMRPQLLLSQKFAPSMLDELRSRLKLEKPQARRVYEILRFAAARGDPQASKDLRLAVKSRLNAPFQKTKKEEAKVKAALERQKLQRLVREMLPGGSGDSEGASSSAALDVSIGEEEEEEKETSEDAKSEAERLQFLSSEWEALEKEFTKALDRLATHGPRLDPPTLNGLPQDDSH